MRYISCYNSNKLYRTALLFCSSQLYICVVILINSLKVLSVTESVCPLNLRRLPYFLFCGICVVFLCVSPSAAGKAVTGALEVCVRTVIPSLFPFIAVNSIVVDSGFASVLGSWLSRPVRTVFAVSGAGATAFILGALSGFPLGAECTAHLYERGQCTKDDAERMLAFCNNTGPAFLTGGIGAYMWGRPELGVLLYMSQMISAVLVGIALRFTRKEESLPPVMTDAVYTMSPAIFTSAVAGASVTMLKICGFITAFAVLCAMVRAAAAVFGYELQGIGAALIFSFLEITAGAGASAAVGGRVGIALTAAAVGWSGLSVHMQTAAVLSQKGLSMNRYAVGKAAQGLLCGLIAYAGASLLYL